MLQFTKLIKANDRVREFNFTRPSLVADSIFRVDVSDDRGNRIIFNLRKEDNNQWKITEQDLPKWIYEIETELQNAIEEQMHQA
jgi:hypothetical protein